MQVGTVTGYHHGGYPCATVVVLVVTTCEGIQRLGSLLLLLHVAVQNRQWSVFVG